MREHGSLLVRFVKETVWASSTDHYERVLRVPRARAQLDLQIHAVLLIGEVVDAQVSPCAKLAEREALREGLKVLVLDVRNGAHNDAERLRARGSGACLDGECMTAAQGRS